MGEKSLQTLHSLPSVTNAGHHNPFMCTWGKMAGSYDCAYADFGHYAQVAHITWEIIYQVDSYYYAGHSCIEPLYMCVERRQEEYIFEIFHNLHSFAIFGFSIKMHLNEYKHAT